MRYTLIVHIDPASGFRALIAELPDCNSVGITLPEVIANTRKALAKKLSTMIDANISFPSSMTAKELVAAEVSQGAHCSISIDIHLNQLGR